MTRTMPWGAPIGDLVPERRQPALPGRAAMVGAQVRLDPLNGARDADALFDAFAGDREGRGWTYLPDGPSTDRAEFRAFIARCAASQDPLFFAMRPAGDDRAAGFASFLRMIPAAGSIEVGFIHFAPRLQRSFAANEAMHLMAAHAFDLGYRRYEWKCDALNVPSRAAAARLGFSYEGTFRQATMYKGRNRDTAWFAITDADWPAIGRAHRAWLSPANRDAEGRPIASLTAMTRPSLISPA